MPKLTPLVALIPLSLSLKAYSAAMKRARDFAEQTASQTGLKLGDIVSVANSTSSFDRFSRARGAGGMMFAMAAAPKMAMLKLRPGTVEREASVTITYAVLP
jgi:uncharacterized protein YggE